MSYISTGVSAISPTESGMSCSSYYDDTTMLDFTSSGTIDIIQQGNSLASIPLTDISSAITDWSISSARIKPGAEYHLNAQDTGTRLPKRQQVQFEIPELDASSPRYIYCELIGEDTEGNLTTTGKIDISSVSNMLEFKTVLEKAIEEKGIDLNFFELYTIDSEYTFTVRACSEGTEYTYRLLFYLNDTDTFDAPSNETVSAFTYKYASPSFIALFITYDEDGSGDSSSCGCKKKKSCWTTENTYTSSSNSCGSSSSSSSSSSQQVIKWTTQDLYDLYGKDEKTIWDNISKVLIHCGAQSTSDTDDGCVKPIVLWNTTDMYVNVKILLAN